MRSFRLFVGPNRVFTYENAHRSKSGDLGESHRQESPRASVKVRDEC